MIKNTVKSENTIKSSIKNMVRKYFTVLIHCQYVVDELYSQELSQDYNR